MSQHDKQSSFVRSRSGAWLLLGYLCAANAIADSVITDVDMKHSERYCIPQTSVTRYLTSADQIYLNHLLVVATPHQGLNGDIFVGLQRVSQPGKLWLQGDTSHGGNNHAWVLYDPAQPPLAFQEVTGVATLAALNPVPVFVTEAQFESFRSDTTLLVGYGLRGGSSATVTDSFNEMVASSRFLPIWGPVPLPGRTGGDGTYGDEVCLSVTKMQTNTQSRVPTPGSTSN